MDKDNSIIKVTPRHGRLEPYPCLYLEDEDEKTLSDAMILLHRIRKVAGIAGFATEHPFCQNLCECASGIHYKILEFYEGSPDLAPETKPDDSN